MTRRPVEVTLEDGRRWLRVADEAWSDPLDPTFAARRGGRWNPPGSFATLYLNADLRTARAQIERMLGGFPADPEDLDPPYVLVAATLPRRQVVADAVTSQGLTALGLPPTYPVDADGGIVARTDCQDVGAAVQQTGLRGVSCRSAATTDGSGRELAWFPARRSSRARPDGAPIPFHRWWSASELPDDLPHVSR